MTTAMRTWEHSLLDLAHAGSEASVADTDSRFQRSDFLVHDAYNHCREMTRLHSRSFFLASALLSREKRQAVRALYAFCRTTDDIVDHPGRDVGTRLETWRQRTLSWHPPAHDPVAVAWADARAGYQIPQRYAEQLIDGVARDLHQTRYETFEELATYCYGVASTVGLMSMHIIGFEGEEAIPYAIKLGVALQLTNILRDVGEDWERGRLYLPLEELAFFGLDEEDIVAGVVTPEWRTFMRFQIGRTRRMYAEAWPGIGLLHKEGRLAIAAAADFYRAILDDIERHDYDTFKRRAHVTQWGKLRRLPGSWWETRKLGRPAAHKQVSPLAFSD